MSKSYRNRRSNYLRGIKRGTTKALPVIKNSLKNIGTTVKKVALPAVNKGLETVYKGLSIGVNMGIKGATKGYKKLSRGTRRRRHR
jgi:hypothetical protein